MEDNQTQDLGLRQTPINDVSKISQLPKNFKFGQKLQYAIFEKEMELYPSTGNQYYYQNQHIKFTLSVANDRMRFLYGPGSYLSAQITISDATTAAATTAQLDSTTSCFFSECKTIGGTTLEYILEQNILMNILMDQCDPYLRKTYYSFFGGGNAFGVQNDMVTAYVTATDPVGLCNCNIRDGYIFNCGYTAGPPVVRTTESRYFLFLLPSGIWGCWQKNLLPLSEIPLGLLLDFLTDSNSNSLVSTNTNLAYSLYDIRFKMSIIELNEILSDSVRRIYDNLYIIPFETYVDWQATITTGTTSGIINIPINNKYVKAIIVAFRSNTIANSATDRTLSTRAKAGLTQYYFSVNGQVLPQTPVYLTTDLELTNNGLFYPGTSTGGDSRGFIQVQKIWNNVPGFNSTCSYACNEFNSTGMASRGGTTAIAIAGKGAFFMGLNLESLTSEMDLFRTTTAVSGYNVQFRYYFNAALTQNVVVSIFLWIEGDLVIENGVANVDL